MNKRATTQWQTVSSSTVYAAIANASVASNTPSQTHIGDITLHDHQHDAVARLNGSIREFGGALLADTVGLGKTYVALAIASQFKHVHVLAPANLLPMWRSAIAATHRVNVSLHSLHTLSRRALANNNPQRETLVIVDEAHHLRTQNTARYRNAAQFMTGRSALLMTATPIHNSTRELRNILALFLGHRADSLDEAILSTCVVRRTPAEVPSATLPAVHEHSPYSIADNPPVLESILTLPTPLPTQDGASASALVRLGLLRAWCSSDAALTDVIRRRQMRGEALLHSLAHGRYPTQRELQTWIVGNDSIQLGFPELLVATSTENTRELLATLTKHLDSLNALLQLHTHTATADPQRASMLRKLLHEDTPIIAFSQFASTVRALYRALSDVAGVASLTSQGGRIAGGPIARHELIAQFAPRAHGRPPPPPHEQIRLLLTTDMLSEGVNLQDAGILVHLDLPWTDAARAQRIGRLARLGAQHETIQVHTLAPPPGADRTLRLVDTLKRKASLSDRVIGSTPDSRNFSRTPHESAAELATRFRKTMLSWQQKFGCDLVASISSDIVNVSHANATQNGWIAVVNYNDYPIVLARLQSKSALTSYATGDIMRAIDCIADANISYSLRQAVHNVVFATLVESIIADINLWHEDNHISELVGPVPRSLSPSHKRALKLLSQRIALNPAISRNSLAATADRISQSISQIFGAGIESRLESWCQQCVSLKLNDWLNAFFTTVQTELPNRERAKGGKDCLQIRAILALQTSETSRTPEHQSNTT